MSRFSIGWSSLPRISNLSIYTFNEINYFCYGRLRSTYLFRIKFFSLPSDCKSNKFDHLINPVKSEPDVVFGGLIKG